MAVIHVLDQETIDKIAAGEVIERPSSIVKELVENSIDAKANAVTVEIRDGGTSLIRITDNGEGMEPKDVPVAFLRHATSKISRVEDLLMIGSLGFRGEALSSIAAVCQVEMITKRPGALTGIRYQIEGGIEKGMEEIGAPEGTTFLVRNLFYNTPARKKFLKTNMTEAGYVCELMERLALSHPDVSFKLIANGQTKLHTSGNHNTKDVIYGLFGREIAANIVPVSLNQGGITITGFAGKPVVSRGNRTYEMYFVNGRYVKNNMIAKGIEEAYKPYMMQHRYPFVVLYLDIDQSQLDINVHPTKMEMRFEKPALLYDLVYRCITEALKEKELIPQVSVGKESASKKETEKPAQDIPEPFEKIRKSLLKESASPYQPRYDRPIRTRPWQHPYTPASPDIPEHIDAAPATPGSDRLTQVPGNRQAPLPAAGKMQSDEGGHTSEGLTAAKAPDAVTDVLESSASASAAKNAEGVPTPSAPADAPSMPVPPAEPEIKYEQQRLLEVDSVPSHKIIGQLFDTYWLVEFQDKLYIIDQHAAHEKVLYERLLNQLANDRLTVQQLSPPVILTLSLKEEERLKENLEQFAAIGFSIEPFGGREYAVTAVPANLPGVENADIFLELLDQLGESGGLNKERLFERVATMSCKAAVKGNHALSFREADALIGELLQLDNPYNCPHGRPTIIAMSKYELEKKFKRII